jgi:GNAT superfamily N-acetyltransferase
MDRQGLSEKGRTTGGLVVRAVARADFDPWLRLWDGYNAFYKRVGENALPRDVTQSTWERFFDAYEPVHALVAVLEGRIVGLAHYIFHRNTTMRGPTCYMQDLFTDETARGKGVGRALIGAVYDRARDAGSTRVYWQTHESNLTAMQLYDRVATRSGCVVYAKAL